MSGFVVIYSSVVGLLLTFKRDAQLLLKDCPNLHAAALVNRKFPNKVCFARLNVQSLLLRQRGTNLEVKGLFDASKEFPTAIPPDS